MSSARSELQAAWRWRVERGYWNSEIEALRIFHGPGEGTGWLKDIAIEIFGPYAWVIAWGDLKEAQQKEIADFLKTIHEWRCQGAAYVARPEKGAAALPVTFFGEMPRGKIAVWEDKVRISIGFETRQPGLFLDHAPLRKWLLNHSRGWRVLNTFSYTGSLSVAAAVGGATQVVTLDLAKTAVEWAKENWKLNDLPESSAQWFQGDALDWMPKWVKRGEKYDCVILDPPSFAHGKKGSFSTEKDFKKLCEWGMQLLNPGGVLVASMNSAKIPQAKIESDCAAIVRSLSGGWQVLSRIDLPETFPTFVERPEDRYLKGLILRRI